LKYWHKAGSFDPASLDILLQAEGSVPLQVRISENANLLFLQYKGPGIDLIRLPVLHGSSNLFAGHFAGENSIFTGGSVLNNGNSPGKPPALPGDSQSLTFSGV